MNINIIINIINYGLIMGLIRTLKMASAQVVETSVANNSPSRDSNQPDDLIQSRGLIMLMQKGLCQIKPVLAYQGITARTKATLHHNGYLWDL